jgi:predicted cupin superfamily sugar epimerase
LQYQFLMAEWIPDYIGKSMTSLTSQHSAYFWIETLGLTRHPEGGWFGETYRSAETISADALPERFRGARSLCTAIYFLLEQGEFSALHRINSDEIWHFYAGAPLMVQVITPDGDHQQILLGSTPDRGERLQAVVPAGCWFGAESCGGFSLVGCTVAPGFDFEDFEMARCAELSKEFPQYGALITRLTRG